MPRCQCEHCGVKTIEVPWAGKHSPFTWMFEAFGVAVLQSAASTREACELLRIGWEGAHRLMERAVKRGLVRRSLDGFEYAGMDEPKRSGDSQPQAARRASVARQKSFGSGHDYITTLNDLSEGSARVIEVVHGRKHEDAVALLEQIPESHRRRIKAVAMDMWDAYLKAARQVLPEADIVHDRYHISAHLNAAVDRVRKDEHKRLMGLGDDTLKGSKYQWLRTHADKRSSEAVSFRKLHELDLKTSRAWHYKEDFRHFWNYLYAGAAERFYKGWRKAVMSSRLEPIKKVARLIDAHWQEILN
ncbi:MAG: ISL3 family transposase [Verrucomicrobiaceae bacterium]|nr:ISL3 family transposase [Verrucomicrobiaceae bacterium]